MQDRKVQYTKLCRIKVHLLDHLYREELQVLIRRVLIQCQVL